MKIFRCIKDYIDFAVLLSELILKNGAQLTLVDTEFGTAYKLRTASGFWTVLFSTELRGGIATGAEAIYTLHKAKWSVVVLKPRMTFDQNGHIVITVYDPASFRPIQYCLPEKFAQASIEAVFRFA